MAEAPRRRRRTIFLKFKPEVPDARTRKIMDEILANFTSMEGINDIEMGPQTNELSDFSHGISFVIEDEAAHARYRDDAEHKELRKSYIDLVEKSLTTDIEAY